MAHDDTHPERRPIRYKDGRVTSGIRHIRNPQEPPSLTGQQRATLSASLHNQADPDDVTNNTTTPSGAGAPDDPTTVTRQIFTALHTISQHCDGALSKDNVGFNQPDASFGNALDFYTTHGATDETQWNLDWPPETVWAAYDMLGKYRAQLEAFGVSYDNLPAPENPNPADTVATRKTGRQHVLTPYRQHRDAQKKEQLRAERQQKKLDEELTTRTVTVGPDQFGNDSLVISFKFNREIVNAVKIEVPGVKFNPAQSTWHADPLKLDQVKAFAANHQFTVNADITSLEQRVAGQLEEQRRLEAERLADPNWAKRENGTILVDPATGIVSIQTPAFNEERVRAIQKLPGRKWHPAEKINTVTASAELLEFAEQHNLYIDPQIADIVAETLQQQQEFAQLTAATETEFDIPGFGVDLYGYQRAGVEAIVKMAEVDRPRAALFDDMGLGKTTQSIGAIEALDAYPAVIVVPATLKRNWEREFNKAVPGRSVLIVDGTTPQDLSGVDVVVVNYDILGAHVDALKALDPGGVVFDESHYVKNPQSKRTKAAFALTEGLPDERLVLALSGTPVTNKTREFVTQFQLIGRFGDVAKDEKEFLFKFCGPTQEYGYAYRSFWKFDGASNTEELQRRMREGSGETWVDAQGKQRRKVGWYIRRHKKDVLKDLPSKTQQATFIDLPDDAMKKYEAVQADVATYVANRLIEQLRKEKGSQASAEDVIAALSPGNKKYRDMGFASQEEYLAWTRAKLRAVDGNALTELTTLRRLTAELKLPVVKEWVGAFQEATDRKLIVFAHHKSVVDDLAETFNAPKIAGSVGLQDRQDAVDRFQNDPDCNVIICNLQAASEGITLTAASDVLFAEQAWTPATMLQAEARAHRIGQTEQVTAHYLLAENTVDEHMYNMLEKKRKLVESATEGSVQNDDDTTSLEEILGVLGMR